MSRGGLRASYAAEHVHRRRSAPSRWFGRHRPLTFDANGVAHGTGEKVYNYKSGAPMVREEYKDGKLGAQPVVETRRRTCAGNEMDRRQRRGNLSSSGRLDSRRMQYVNSIAEGEAKEYDETGKVTKVLQYQGGKPVSESDRPATRSAPVVNFSMGSVPISFTLQGGAIPAAA